MKWRVREIAPDLYQVQRRFLLLWVCAIKEGFHPEHGGFDKNFPTLKLACDALKDAQDYCNFKPKTHKCCD